MSGSPGLTFYFRDGCHLCEDMWQQLGELRRERQFQVHQVNVDGDPGLVDKYGSLVPVLVSGDDVLCHYYLDLKNLNEFLNRIQK